MRNVKRIGVVGLALVMMAACNSAAKEQKKIEDKEKSLMQAAKQGQVDTALVNDLLNDYERYAHKFPADTMGANYLFKAADFYRYMKQPERSAQIYVRIYENYPDIEKRPYALFLQGFTYENEIGDYNAAELAYQKFLDEYADHIIARDVQVALDNLGKSPEQVLQELMKAHPEDSAALAGE